MRGDYVDEAMEDYFASGANAQPSDTSGIREHDGKEYVVLENVNGILAVYEIDKESGELVHLDAWPKELGGMRGDYVDEAMEDYFASGANAQPSDTSGIREHDGKEYVVLENVNGILAVYEIDKESGELVHLDAWPKELGGMRGDYVDEAMEDYFASGANAQPSDTSGIREHDGKEYVVLENVNGILAVYEIDKESGELVHLDAWPKELEEEW